MSADDQPRRVAAGTIACVALSLVLTVPGLIASGADRVSWNAQFMPTPAEIYHGAWWGLLSGTFIHLGWLHLLFNMLWMYHLSTVMERTIGSARWASFFVVTAFVSGGLQLAAGGWGFGMSGVVYAIFGFMWQARRRYDEFRIAATREVVTLMLTWLVACFVMTWLDWMRVANTAHVTGLVFGYAVAWTLAPRRLLAKKALAWVVVVLLIALTVLVIFGPVRPSLLPARLAKAVAVRYGPDTAARWLRVYTWLDRRNAAAWAALAEVEFERGNLAGATAAVARLGQRDPAAAAEFASRLAPGAPVALVPPLVADAPTPFVDTPDGETATGCALLATLPGDRAGDCWLVAFPDYLGALHLYRASLPPGTAVKDLLGRLWVVTAQAVADEQGSKRFEIIKIEPDRATRTEVARVVFLGTVMTLARADSSATVRVDQAVEGDLPDKSFGLVIDGIAGSGLELGGKYRIEAVRLDSGDVAPYCWTRQQADP